MPAVRGVVGAVVIGGVDADGAHADGARPDGTHADGARRYGPNGRCRIGAWDEDPAERADSTIGEKRRDRWGHIADPPTRRIGRRSPLRPADGPAHGRPSG
jgi:hypothetical protein